MTSGIRPLVAGNWKMNGTSASLAELRSIAAAFAQGHPPACDALICPPATLIWAAHAALGDGVIKLGGQDCHADDRGAHTGDIAALMLKDAGAISVIVGHSERRTNHAETDALVCAKAEAAWRAGLTAIICVGETQDQRDDGETLDVLRSQLSGSVPDGMTAANTVIAYEPVWAIGTGRTPTAEDIRKVHAFIRAELVARFAEEAGRTRILYGGSVKPDNAAEILTVADVNGALVGGASLKARDFLAICEAYGTS
jgi:triosephosphate isomerase (TIM)